MSANKRRHANAVPIASFATWLVMGIFACAAGLGYVWCKNQLHTTGRQIKTLERELVELRNKNEVSRARIAQLSSTAALQQRFTSGFIKLVPIANEHIVMVSDKAGKSPMGELRPVSNEGTRR